MKVSAIPSTSSVNTGLLAERPTELPKPQVPNAKQEDEKQAPAPALVNANLTKEKPDERKELNDLKVNDGFLTVKLKSSPNIPSKSIALPPSK